MILVTRYKWLPPLTIHRYCQAAGPVLGDKAEFGAGTRILNLHPIVNRLSCPLKFPPTDLLNGQFTKNLQVPCDLFIVIRANRKAAQVLAVAK